MRAGTIAIVGRSNVGKSTLLNQILGERLAIVSPLPQTTRDALLGIVRRENAELAFLDTPGIHKPKTELGSRMNSSAVSAAESADVVVFVTDATVGAKLVTKKTKRSDQVPPLAELAPEDAELLKSLKSLQKTPAVLAVNKVDAIRDKGLLLPLLQSYLDAVPFKALVPISALKNDGVDRLLDEIAQLLPEGEAGYPEDTLTDKPSSFFAREYVREQVLLSLKGEIPHAVAVSIDSFDEASDKLRIAATLHVEKVGQRKIIVGTGGTVIKALRLGAENRLKRLLGRKVKLELFVRVTPRWKDAPRMLAELGYERVTGDKS
ncbi:MAG TPA: GTPase Era [Polyangiaceae bacterium]|nr:GTPase Era [Polyangiaceae bacterium]